MGAVALAPRPFSLWEKVAGLSRPDEGLRRAGRDALGSRNPPPQPLSRWRGERPSLVELARLFRQHDRDAIPDRIGEPRGARNELLPNRIVSELRTRHWANKDLEEASVDFGPGRVVCRRGLVRIIRHVPVLRPSEVMSETQSRDLTHPIDLTHFRDDLRRRGPVDRNKRNRRASLLVTPEREGRNIDARVSQ